MVCIAFIGILFFVFSFFWDKIAAIVKKFQGKNKQEDVDDDDPGSGDENEQNEQENEGKQEEQQNNEVTEQTVEDKKNQ